MQVHDSVIFEVPEGALDVALPTIKLIMEDFDFVPAVGVDIEYGRSWGTFHDWDGGPTWLDEAADGPSEALEGMVGASVPDGAPEAGEGAAEAREEVS